MPVCVCVCCVKEKVWNIMKINDGTFCFGLTVALKRQLQNMFFEHACSYLHSDY